jgi:DNA-binding MurR/RpiR family transcriptional regulator
MPSYEERIREVRGSLSPSFARLADFLLDSYAEASFLTATELAHALDLDPATVVRFSQKIGYPGYPELQREIRQKVKDQLLARRELEPGTAAAACDAALQDVAQALDLTRRGFPSQEAQGLLNALDGAKRIVVLAEGLAYTPARSLAAWLEAAGYAIAVAGNGVTEMARAMSGVRKGDLLLTVIVDEQTPFIARAMAEARSAGVKTAALVASPSAKAAQHADLLLTAHASPDPAVGGILIQSLVYALVRMLLQARPGLFRPVQERVSEMTHRLLDDGR